MDQKTVDLIYTAGLLDGEGSIMLMAQTRPGCVRPSHYAVVSLANTDYGIVQWLHSKYGGSLTYRKTKNAGNPNAKAIWCWSTASNKALAFVRAVEPFLRVKKEQAQVALAFATLTGKQPADKRDEVWQQREVLRLRMKELNRRGIAA